MAATKKFSCSVGLNPPTLLATIYTVHELVKSHVRCRVCQVTSLAVCDSYIIDATTVVWLGPCSFGQHAYGSTALVDIHALLASITWAVLFGLLQKRCCARQCAVRQQVQRITWQSVGINFCKCVRPDACDHLLRCLQCIVTCCNFLYKCVTGTKQQQWLVYVACFCSITPRPVMLQLVMHHHTQRAMLH